MNLQHAVFEFGRDLVRIRILGHHKRSLKTAERTLDPVIPLVLFFLFRLALTLQITIVCQLVLSSIERKADVAEW
jgi:hypothetical protein